MLDGGKTFGKNFLAFRAQYFEDENAAWNTMANHFPKFIAKPGADKELNAEIYKKAIRVLKKDCLDLPPLIEKTVLVPLGKDQARLYEEMRDEFLTFIEDSKKAGNSLAVVANLAITKALRLQQIASGFVKTEQGEEIAIKDNPRREVLKDYLEELTPSHKVIVWASFIQNYGQIAQVCEELGIKYTTIYGGMSVKAKQEAIDKFERESDVRVIIGNRAAGGIGVNLVQASYSIVYSRNFSLGDEEQSKSRNHRSGSEIHKRIVKIDLAAKGTIDEFVLEALLNKQKIATKILDWKL